MKQNGLAIAAVAGLAAATLALSPAKAQVLGTVSLTGTDVTTGIPSTTIMFTSGEVVNNTSTGVFAAPPGPFPHNGGTTDVGMNETTRNYFLPAQWNGTQLFGSTPLDAVNISSFNSLLSSTPDPNVQALTLTGNALLTIAGVGNLPGVWEVNTQVQFVNPGQFSTTWSGTVTAVPGPIVGAGLPGLIAALGGLVAMARRRRNQLA